MTKENFIIYETGFDGLKLVKSIEFHDNRGSLQELFDDIVLEFNIRQINHVRTKKSCLRGLHYQYPTAQTKLISILSGSIFDVCVDLRESSWTYGKWFGINLLFSNELLLVPSGFAHGFYAYEDSTIIYMMDNPRIPEQEQVIRWCDSFLNIAWPDKMPVLSPRDANAQCWFEAEKFE